MVVLDGINLKFFIKIVYCEKQFILIFTQKANLDNFKEYDNGTVK